MGLTDTLSVGFFKTNKYGNVFKGISPVRTIAWHILDVKSTN